MHPNDTLQGKLLAWERPEDRPWRRCFGYWRMVEERMIRAQIAAEGGDPRDVFAVSRRVEANHANDLSLREQQALRPVRLTAAPPAFTPDELAHMAEHFAGANDPLGQSIAAKVALITSS